MTETLAAQAPGRSQTPGPHGPVVAMVGAGQLARMTHQAAIALGVRLRVLATGRGDSAVLAGAESRLGSPESLSDLRDLAAGASALTFDHEQIPGEHLAALEDEGVRLCPTAQAKRLAQDKLHARRRLSEHGFPIPPFALAHSETEVGEFASLHGWPVVAKLPRGGYDGRGVFWLERQEDAQRLLAAGGEGLLLEPALDLENEFAVLIAGGTNGEQAVYPVVKTVQRDGMCREILAPAAIPAGLADEAQALARSIAEAFGLTGIVALELFHVDGKLLVNELALRPHNSGHYTIEGCTTSQFEQHLRAVLGWPLGRPDLTAPAVATVNVVGDPEGGDPKDRIQEALALPGVHVHLYGKQARPGRKLGHVTVRGEEPDAVLAVARQAAARLEGRHD